MTEPDALVIGAGFAGLPYAVGMAGCRQICSDVATHGYEDFQIRSASEQEECLVLIRIGWPF
jgi:hypothetical protein